MNFLPNSSTTPAIDVFTDSPNRVASSPINPGTGPTKIPLYQKKSAKNRWLVGLGVIGLITAVIGLAVTLQLSRQGQDLGKKAAPATTLTLQTSDTSVTLNQVFSVNINTDTGANVVKALDISLTYDPTVLQLQDVTKGTWLEKSTVAIKKIDQTKGEALIGLVIYPTEQPNYVTGTGTSAVATFKALKASPSTSIKFDRTFSVAGAANEHQNVVSNYNDLILSVAEELGPPIDTEANFIVYTYEACLPQNSDGKATIILWQPETFTTATAIDVSTQSNFASYASKSTTGATTTSSGWLTTNGTGFRANGLADGQLFVFNPAVSYYFRLHYGSNAVSGVITYQATACAATGGTTNKQCNESCASNSECATNLICSNNKCRRDGNTGNESCVLPPDNGIHRSCNEYCSNTGECGSNYVCWYNQCRNPKDTTQANCKIPLKPGEVEGCNLYCANDGECASGLSCWYNQCRLAQNLTSQTCQVVPTAKPVSANRIYPTATPTPLKVKAKIVIDGQPSPTKAFVMPTSRPTTRPTLIPTMPAKVATKGNSAGFLSAVPAILGIVFIGVVGLIFWPQIKTRISPPKPNS